MPTPRPYGIGPYGVGLYSVNAGAYLAGAVSRITFGMQGRAGYVWRADADSVLRFSFRVHHPQRVSRAGSHAGITFGLIAHTFQVKRAESFAMLRFSCTLAARETFGAEGVTDCKEGQWTVDAGQAGSRMPIGPLVEA